ncbi:MAG: hypothetical protein IJQ39_12440 [Thermoguttaceae bacterium]|nr:hypothetical protein [Thermoguttaceae bacterium]
MSNCSNYQILDTVQNPFSIDLALDVCRIGKLALSPEPSADGVSDAPDGARDAERSCYVRRCVQKIAPSANRRLLKYQGGFDGGVELAFYGEFEPCVLNWFKSFDDLREKIRSGDELAAFTDLFGIPIKISPSGARVGHLTYSYQFYYHGITFLFHRSPNQDVPAVRVVIGAVPLLRASIQDVYSFIVKVLNFAGVNVYREIVSRADLMVMTSDYSVFDFLSAMQNDHYITRCRGKLAIYADLTTSKVESLTLKSSRVELCIYDKLAEVVTKDAVYYKWFCSRFGGELPKVLTRVEFRFRREALRYYGINKFSDLLTQCGALVEKFSSCWFRILSRKKVRGSENEIPSAACWKMVQEAFRRVFSSEYSLPVVCSVKSAVCKVEKLVSMASGCIAKACALLQRSKEPIKEISDAVFDLFYPLFKKIDDKRVSAALELSADGYYLEDLI